MLDANTLQWLEHRKITCNRCGARRCCLPRQGKFTGECDHFKVKAPGMESGILCEDFQDAAEFEARVVAKLNMGTVCIDCVDRKIRDCPIDRCTNYFNAANLDRLDEKVAACRLRKVRAEVEEEMIAEGKGPGRQEEVK